MAEAEEIPGRRPIVVLPVPWIFRDIRNAAPFLDTRGECVRRCRNSVACRYRRHGRHDNDQSRHDRNIHPLETNAIFVVEKVAVAVVAAADLFLAAVAGANPAWPCRE